MQNLCTSSKVALSAISGLGNWKYRKSHKSEPRFPNQNWNVPMKGIEAILLPGGIPFNLVSKTSQDEKHIILSDSSCVPLTNNGSLYIRADKVFPPKGTSVGLAMSKFLSQAVTNFLALDWRFFSLSLNNFLLPLVTAAHCVLRQEQVD